MVGERSRKRASEGEGKIDGFLFLACGDRERISRVPSSASTRVFRPSVNF